MTLNENGVQAVIFDVDGLLIDSEPLWCQAEIEIFGELGLDYAPANCSETQGLRPDQAIASVFEKRPWTGPSVQEVTQHLLDQMIILIAEQGMAMEGAVQTVNFFIERGVRIAIASSSPHNIINANISALGLDGCFEVICSAENERYGKPNPAVYISTADKLGVNRRQCLVFEDSVMGVLAAKAAEMTCICVPEAELLGDKRLGIADLVLKSLADFDERTWETISN